MRIINIHEAKTHFSKLIQSVLHGHEVIIAMSGTPVAKLGSIGKKPKKRFGVLKNKIRISKDFDAPLPPHILDDFEA